MSLEPSKQKRWTEEEILKLLCLLNENIEYIRAEFEADKKRGINVAANVLSEAIGNDCTPSRVRGKLEHLWENAGPPGGRKFKSSDSLYRFGGWTRTLPSLDAMFPGMLDNIALAGQGKQHTRCSDKIRIKRDGLRRREEDENDDPIQCKCGYTHFASSCVHCKFCPTWQHIWCYYDSDVLSDAPADHTCDQCASGDTDTMTMDDESSTFPVDSGSGKVNEALCQGFAALKTQDDAPFLKTEGEHSKPTYTEGKSITRHQNSFSILCLELDNNLDYSPPDEDVQSAVKTITSVIRIVAHSLATDDFQVEIFSSSMLQHYPDISDIVRERTVSEFVRDIDSMQENHVPFLKMALSWALWSWTFYPSTSPALPVPDNAKTRSELLLDFYKEITLPERRFFRILNETSANQPRGELKLLQGLYSTAWSSLMKGRPLILQSIIRTEAEELAQRLLRMLSLYIKRSESSDDRRPLKTSEEWIKTTKNGRSRFKLIVELFASCIKLRDSLKMSRYNYELYYPTSSEIQFVEVDARPDGNYHHINFYFAPAILQYESNESNTFHDTETVGGILLGRQNVARMTDEQRTESRVVCPAVVGLG